MSRIRIRATTITDWDRNELNRIVINVGVAYGADTDRARELLLGAAQEHPRILEDPPPIASFEGFGDNSLNLVLRCYMPSLDGRLGVITELHSAIDVAFNEAGIEISFPQRDVHVDARRPLEVRVLPEKPQGRGPSEASSGSE